MKYCDKCGYSEADTIDKELRKFIHFDDLWLCEVCVVAENKRLREALENITHLIDQFNKAYPEDIFEPITKAEREWLRKKQFGLLDRISAGMGRHISKVLKEALKEKDE